MAGTATVRAAAAAAHPSVCPYFYDSTKKPKPVLFAVQDYGNDPGYAHEPEEWIARERLEIVDK